MKEVVTRTWCDHCDAYHDGERTVSTVSHVITIDSGKRLRLDLCEDGEREVMGVLIELLASHGDVQDKSSPAPGAAVNSNGRAASVRCPVCQEDLKRGSLIGHAEKKHGLRRRPQPDICPTCQWPSPDPSSPQVMGMHRARAHQYDPVAEVVTALEVVRDGGDPAEALTFAVTDPVPDPPPVRTRRPRRVPVA